MRPLKLLILGCSLGRLRKNKTKKRGGKNTKHSHVRAQNFRMGVDRNTGKLQARDWEEPPPRKANEELLDHQRKRKVSSKLPIFVHACSASLWYVGQGMVGRCLAEW